MSRSEKLRAAARDYGWLLSLAVSLGSLLLVYVAFRAAPETAATIGIDTGDTIKVIAREPGSGFPTAAFACDPATFVGLPTPMTDAPAGGTRYIATRGTESLNWPDSPPGANPQARHYWHNSDPAYIDPETGRPAAIGQLVSEDAEITKPAAECLKRRAPK